MRADLAAGVTVALVLIPQSMAYAQLAGMPPYYGLYAAFLPVIIGALWGSSHQLATGPVAVVSLLTASALAPLAAAGSEQFITLAIALALMVGLIQLVLGLLKLGALVNFLSHPVIIGFTNAAALIIAFSQLSKLLGVSMGRSEHFFLDVWEVLQQVGHTHLPTLLMGALAIGIIWGCKKFLPRAPGVLIAVTVSTLLSLSINFERNGVSTAEEIEDVEVRNLAIAYQGTETLMAELSRKKASITAELRRISEDQALAGQHAAALRYQVEILELEHKSAMNENRKRMRDLRKFVFEREPGEKTGEYRYLPYGQAANGDGNRWRIKKIQDSKIQWAGGGEVVGGIPPGLPAIKAPVLDLDTFMALLSVALVISLVGFMEAISIAKAIATQTRQRLDPNQELIGQGLANITGAFTQCFPSSGSFSRSAVNIGAGAKTGMSSVFTGLIVLVVLLFLTHLLHHLPQAVLAAIIIMAVASLINFKAIHHAWRVQRHDGIAAVVTFCATLVFAPHLDNGILAGAGLALVLYLYRSMKPRVAILSRHPDGALRDARVHNLPLSEHIAVVRFDGQLYFANVPYFEDAILGVTADFPKARHILVVADGINQIDASGEEVIAHLHERLKDAGIGLTFSGLKKQVVDVLRATGLLERIGETNIFANEEQALEAIYQRIGDPTFNAASCPLTRIPIVT